MNIFIIFLLYALNGTAITMCKIMVTLASPLFILGIRMTTVGILLLGFYRFILGRKIKIPRGAIHLLAQSAICNIFIPFSLRFWAVQYVTATKVSLFYTLGPFTAHTISCLLGLEKNSKLKILGLTIGFASIIPTLMTSSSTESNFESFFFFNLPEVALLTAMVAFSYSWVIIQKIVRTYDLSPFLINGINTLVSGLLALSLSFIIETNHTIAKPLEFIGWLALIITVTNLICYNLYAVILKKFSSTLLSFASLTMPFYASFTAWLYFGEKLSLNNILSIAIVFIGLTIFYYAERNNM